MAWQNEPTPTPAPLSIFATGPAEPGVRWRGLRIFFDLVLAAAAVWFLLSSTINLLQEQPEKWFAGLLLFCNGVLSAVGFIAALTKTRPLFLVIFYFNFVFLSIGPMNQLAILEDPIYSVEELVELAIFLCLAFTSIALAFVLPRERSRGGPLRNERSASIYEGQPHLYFLCVISVALSVGLLIFYWPVLLESREALDRYMAASFSKTTIIIFVSFLNPLAFITAIIGWIVAYRTRSYGWTWVFVLCVLLAAVVNNPINFARFRVSTLAVFAVMLQFGIYNVRLLTAVLIVGTAISGYLNLFRFNQIWLEPSAREAGPFASMDYHILNLICYAIKYTNEVGYSYGSNLLSAFLFFVPRSVWEEKSEHISSYFFEVLQRYRYYGTNNLSSPIVAEGYFAFGLAGALILSVATLYVFRFIERRGLTAGEGTCWHLLLCISPMLTLITMRGSFLVGVSEICGHYGAVLLSFALVHGFQGRHHVPTVDWRSR